MWITFTKDAYLGDPIGTPDYKAGYQVDVNVTFGKTYIASGHAVEGKVELVKPEPVKESEPEKVEEEPAEEPKVFRGKRNR